MFSVHGLRQRTFQADKAKRYLDEADQEPACVFSPLEGTSHPQKHIFIENPLNLIQIF